MSHLLDDDDPPRSRGERELTLSTGAILGIFFGLTLLCGCFFAFGYNMGRKSTLTVVAGSSENTNEAYAPSSSFNTFNKPSAGLPATGAVSTGTPQSVTNQTTVVGPPHASGSQPVISTTTTTATQVKTPSAEPTAESTPAPSRPATPAAPMPAISSNGTFVVQVAAVSHQEDAELLVSALQRKGYTVAARSQAGDKLVHIQVGPFGTHKDADAMRQRLSGDGYNAIIKQL